MVRILLNPFWRFTLAMINIITQHHHSTAISTRFLYFKSWIQPVLIKRKGFRDAHAKNAVTRLRQFSTCHTENPVADLCR